MNGVMLACSIVLAAGAAASAQTGGYALGDPIELSVAPVGGFDGQNAAKGKMLFTEFPDGSGGFTEVVFSVYADAQGPDVWTFSGSTHAARDIFATYSLDGGATWSEPINISNTAGLTSMSADHDGDPATAPLPYHGDSEKPTVFLNGKNVTVTWVDRYVPSGLQESVVYPAAGLIEVPYAATYVVRSTDGGRTWGEPQMLTDGSRDAKQDSSRASSAGFIITWQEDPKGLQPGDAEGPGEGGSGARTSQGTDIWYTALRTPDFVAGAPFPAPQRLTDNFTRTDKDGDESGQHGASRANTFLFGSMAIVAYEETKGLQGLDDGKYVRYHTFSAFDDSMPDPTEGAGWILSMPEENARRVRFIVQPGPLLSSSDTRIVFIYKQGDFDKGGPSDIMMRIGRLDPADPDSTGFRPQDLHPPIDPAATTRDIAFNNEPEINLSSSMGLSALPQDDPFEDARAHRGVLRGDNIALGWSWTRDWALARFTDLENYNFYMRRSFDGGRTWTEAANLSNIPASEKVHVREPRIVATPFGPNPAHPTDTDAFMVAWGTEVNQFEHVADRTLDLDIFVTRTEDFGETFATPQRLNPPRSSVEEGNLESQFRLSHAGDTLFAVWMGEDRAAGVVNTMYRGGSATCAADFDHNGELDLFDFLAFQDAFAAGDLSADFDGDGVLSLFDFLSFQNAFHAGCG
jgi:hypothetical protein